MNETGLVRRKVVKGEIEKKIATASIVSTSFCKEMFPIYQSEYIQAPYVRKVLSWVKDYFERYKKSPKKKVEDLFAVEKDKLKDDEIEMIESFLSRISDEYRKEKTFNYQYILDQTEAYFRKRSLQITFERGMGYIAKDKVEEAEELVTNYGKVTKLSGNWVDPFDPKVIEGFLKKEKDPLFGFGGSVGEMAGSMERTWLSSFMAPMKRGKSWWLQETAIQGLFYKLNVLFVSLEMNLEMMEERLYKRVVGYSGKKESLVFPIFDCLRNQNGSCERKIRKGGPNIIGKDGKLLRTFDPSRKYRPCFVCREKNLKDFISSLWWVQSKEMNVDKNQIKEKIKRFTKLYGSRLKLVSYPAFSASVKDIELELDKLENMEGFIPDLIIIDYADILASGDNSLSERGRIDHVWKRLKQMAAIRHCLVFTASQSNRGSIDKRSISQIDTAEDIRKIAHVDVMIGINQTAEEKDRGECRLGIIAHRHKSFSQNKQVRVLQQLEVGIPLLDSCWVN